MRQIGKLSVCMCTKTVIETWRVSSSNTKEDTSECGKLHDHLEA